MKINKNSWHYRFHMFWGDAPKYLCPYFWWLVAKLLLAVFLIVLILTSIVGIGAIALGFILANPSLDFLNTISGSLLSFGVGVLLISIVSVGVFIHCEYIKPYFDRRKKEKFMKKLNLKLLELQNPKEKEKSIFGLWWNAKKEKVCPKLDFE